MSDARLVTYARCSRLYSPGHRDISREYSRATKRAAAASGHLVTPLSRQGVGTGGGEAGWLWDWERRVLGRQGVLPAMASLVSWHLCGISVVASLVWQNASSRSGSTHAGRCDSSTLEYRTAELADETADLSHSLCDVCDGRNTPVGRSDRGNERGYAASQRHAYVMRRSAASAERCRTGSPRGGSRRAPTGVQGPRGPRATQPRSCAARGAVGVAGFRIYAIEAHTQVPRATARPRRSTAERSGGAFGVWGRTPGTGVAGSADPAHTTVDTGIRVLVGTGRLNAIMSRLRWGPCLLTVCCNVAGHM